MNGGRGTGAQGVSGWDVLLAATLLGYAGTELFAFHLGGPQPAEVQLGFAAATTVPLVWRRRAPLLVLTIVAGAFGLKGIVFQPPPELLSEAIAYLTAIYTAANRTTRRPAIVAGIAALAAGELRLLGTEDLDVGENAVNIAFAVTGWVGGRAVRRLESRAVRSEQLASAAEQDTREAIADERARIARELHDIVSHSLGVTVLQARGGRRMLTVDPAEARAAFDTIEEAGEQALDEMRRLLGVLRDTDEPRGPQPGLDALPTLIERVEATGLRVEVHERGHPVKLPPGLELCAYRLVQEALTNCVRHARASTVVIEVMHHADALELRVEDDGIGPASESALGLGHGLIGMRERVALFDGALEAGQDPNGGFAVRARFPLVAAP